MHLSLSGCFHSLFLTSTDKPSWETHITPGRQSMSVHISSTVPAEFSAQLCVLTESGCEPRGHIHSESMVSLGVQYGNKCKCVTFPFI